MQNAFFYNHIPDLNDNDIIFIDLNIILSNGAFNENVPFEYKLLNIEFIYASNNYNDYLKIFDWFILVDLYTEVNIDLDYHAFVKSQLYEYGSLDEYRYNIIKHKLSYMLDNDYRIIGYTDDFSKVNT